MCTSLTNEALCHVHGHKLALANNACHNMLYVLKWQTVHACHVCIP